MGYKEAPLPVNAGGTGAVTASAARTNLGLGSASTLSTPITETNGGTNQTTYAQGDILYSSAANTLAKLAKDTNSTRYLSNTGSSNNPAWAQINLTNGVTGTLPIANGGTGTTSGTTPGNLVLIQSQTASSSANLSFTTGISSTYDVYFIEFIKLIPQTDNVDFRMTLSTDGGSSYSSTTYSRTGRINSANAAVATDVTGTAQAAWVFQDNIDNGSVGGVNGWCRFYNPSSSSVYKSMCSMTFIYNNSANVLQQANTEGMWSTTTAVNAIRFAFSSGNISSGIINLYGVSK